MAEIYDYESSDNPGDGSYDAAEQAGDRWLNSLTILTGQASRNPVVREHVLDTISDRWAATEAEREYLDGLPPELEEGDRAIDWLLAVRKFGVERANLMFPHTTQEG